MSRLPWRRRRELTTSLTETMRAKATQVHASASITPFDPERPRSLDADVVPLDYLDATIRPVLVVDADAPPRANGDAPPPDAADGDQVGDDPARQERQEWTTSSGGVVHKPGGSGRLLPAAAVVILVMLVGAAVALRLGGDGDRGDRGDVAVDTAMPAAGGSNPSFPAGALLPTWMPDQVEPWIVEWTQRSFPGQAGERYQLFGDPDAGRAVLVGIVPGDTGIDPGGQPIVVRGRDGVLQSETGGPRSATMILWSEDGASITAWSRGLTQSETTAALGLLEWRSSTHVDGFASPADGSFPLRGETSPVDGYDILSADLGYAEGVPTVASTETRLVLDIRTFVWSGTEGGESKDFLEDWFYGARRADGSAQWYDGASGSLRRSWPDGRSLQIVSRGVADQATLERIADSARRGTSADLVSLEGRANAHAAELPVLASVDLSVGNVKVHGQGGFLALCLQVRADVEPDCDEPHLGEFWLQQVDAAASWVVGGRWYVAVASTAPDRVVIGDPSLVDRSDLPTSGDGALPGETAHDGRWQVLVGQPGSGTDVVSTPVREVSRPS